MDTMVFVNYVVFLNVNPMAMITGYKHQDVTTPSYEGVVYYDEDIDNIDYVLNEIFTECNRTEECGVSGFRSVSKGDVIELTIQGRVEYYQVLSCDYSRVRAFTE
jgi:hypothetical protein